MNPAPLKRGWVNPAPPKGGEWGETSGGAG